MKTKSLCFLCGIILFAATTAASAQTVIASGNCGFSGSNLTWTLTSDSTLTVRGRGLMANYNADGNNTSAPWNSYKNQINRVVVEEGVTDIGDYAFYRHQKLKSAVIFEGAKNIGMMSFFSCSRLSSVTLPSSVRYIEKYAFEYCYWLDTIICKSITPPSLEYTNAVFTEVPAVAGVFVPCNAVAAYQNSGSWVYFADAKFHPIETLAPKHFTVTKINSGFTAAWQGVADSYRLYRNGELLATVNGMEYTDTDVVEGNEYCYKVQAAGGSCESEFAGEICVNETPNADATLASLTVSDGALTPAFSSTYVSYTVNVTNSVAAIHIAATATDAAATVEGTGAKALQIGENLFPVTVTAEDGTTTKTYTVKVVREGYSTNATLASLTVSDCVLAPAFHGAVTDYSAEAPHTLTAVNITATAVHSGATITGTGAKALQVGGNTFSITVTAQDGVTTKTYTVNVIRANDINPETDATLTNLTVSDCVLTPAFSSTVTDYTAEVPYTLTGVYIAATVAQTGATVAGTGVKTLEVGANLFPVTVTARDGITTKTYTVNIVRETSDTDATLADLAVRANMTPAFNSAVTDYTVDFTAVDIVATASDPAATVTGTGVKILQTGENVFNITVTARNGITTRTYTIRINQGNVSVQETGISSKLTVYPNPVVSSFTVDYEGAGQLTVFNMSGREMLTRPVNGKTEIHVSHLPAGAYLVHLYSNGKVAGSVKIIKQ